MGNEDTAATLFAKLVSALQEAFTAKDVAFTSLFTLDAATETRTSDLLGVEVLANEDPQDAIADFNLQRPKSDRTQIRKEREMHELYVYPIPSPLLYHLFRGLQFGKQAQEQHSATSAGVCQEPPSR
ncbi:hypothetical protein CYMTET_2553 [Cymbomonas tetramitiformis]|uniref:Uncharacterized protein n=1 Tax=Cymbomonas tetramitiformis TaxID=36881 RepID=A0AAE0H5H5_9CHLO|nr:hypothetical protein CYMTET_2553 [Cymbomonas tetramitiformis]